MAAPLRILPPLLAQVKGRRSPQPERKKEPAAPQRRVGHFHSTAS